MDEDRKIRIIHSIKKDAERYNESQEHQESVEDSTEIRLDEWELLEWIVLKEMSEAYHDLDKSYYLHLEGVHVKIIDIINEIVHYEKPYETPKCHR